LGLPGDVVWHSSDEKVATVSGGLVRAVSNSQTQIVAV
jgi:hypothetical protein